MDDTVDPLKIKIEKAKRQLPLETANAIDSVDWKVAILGMRIKHGYTFEQLGDLELETELLLSGLISPEDYPKELSRRMGISGAAASELVNEMNDLVFKKIKEERERLTEILKKMSVMEKVYPSDANFLLVRVKDANYIYNTLIDKNIIVRNRSSVIGNCIRITVGKPYENNKLINALKSI